MEKVKDMTDVELSERRTFLTGALTVGKRERYGISEKNLRDIAPVVQELVDRGYGPYDLIATSRGAGRPKSASPGGLRRVGTSPQDASLTNRQNVPHH